MKQRGGFADRGKNGRTMIMKRLDFFTKYSLREGSMGMQGGGCQTCTAMELEGFDGGLGDPGFCRPVVKKWFRVKCSECRVKNPESKVWSPP